MFRKRLIAANTGNSATLNTTFILVLSYIDSREYINAYIVKYMHALRITEYKLFVLKLLSNLKKTKKQEKQECTVYELTTSIHGITSIIGLQADSSCRL